VRFGPYRKPDVWRWAGHECTRPNNCEGRFLVQYVPFFSCLGQLEFRTHRISFSLSTVSHAAVKIGSDVLEVAGDGTHYFNGNSNGNLPKNITMFSLIKQNKPICKTLGDELSCLPRVVFKIDLDLGEEISIVAFKGMLKVQVEAVLPNAVGLMGNTDKPGLIARDGETVLQPTEMGIEWQVQQEPLLFHTTRAPQFPQTCILPAQSTARRLGEEEAFRRLGEQACVGVSSDAMKSACIFDVQQTGDVDLALGYIQGSE
jgi:hypothetical protein